MSTLLAKLTFGLTAAVAVGFYYLAAAPPAVAQLNICGPGNYSDACASDSKTSSTSTSTITDVYTTQTLTQEPTTSVPEPSTAIALLMTSAGIIYSAKKRKQLDRDH
ncbi:PEP-CTERM sorting domain-containing protein [Kamptonema animale CS-326]|jgi:hypothetical protein|uniref:PEP-CTERM sorting domain-containing protein n=1 Tax=Kamptonema animale TaxID=92934 RepID=UPI002330AFA6|nr:PEP-CTERM sorting domain-containing protein [Kamptonema animale]MDB9512214.1 PEP-CTERM sorting domain-containing protein [Kamptonema animale CS-326]